MATTNEDHLPDDDTLTLDIRGAAAYATGGIVSTFKRKFVETGLVQLIDLGGRSPRILKSQIRDAVLKIAADQAAHPELKIARSGGAVLAARGRIANPWGRKGRPPEAKPQPKAKSNKRVGA